MNIGDDDDDVFVNRGNELSCILNEKGFAESFNNQLIDVNNLTLLLTFSCDENGEFMRM